LQAKRQRLGIHSLEVGLRLARVLSVHGVPMALKDLAASAHMPPAKAHRYLVSLIRAGLAEQDRESGRYRLGPLALELGLSALRGVDVLKFGGEVIAELRAQTDETVLLAVWGNKGPVVARWEESTRPVATNVRAGWVMPLANSATGRCFAAYLPAGITAPMLKAEFVRMPVFGHAGGIVAVIAALGPQGGFDVAWDGPIAAAVKRAARELSSRLGHRT
jgi:DNA-binding IclR family transcriptional regulator